MVTSPESAAPVPPPVKAVPVMKDMAVGTEEEDDEDEVVTEQKLEKLLLKEIPVHKPKTRKPKKEKCELDVDRI